MKKPKFFYLSYKGYNLNLMLENKNSLKTNLEFF